MKRSWIWTMGLAVVVAALLWCWLPGGCGREVLPADGSDGGIGQLPPRPRFRAGSIGLEFQYVPGGTFTMGGAEEMPRHAVTLSPFYVARRQVSREQYRIHVEETGVGAEDLEAPSWPVPPLLVEGQPIMWLPYARAAAFADWLSAKEGRPISLISEAQWEYVARSGEPDPRGTQDYWWQSRQGGAEGNWILSGNYPRMGPSPLAIAPLGFFPATPWGITVFSTLVWTSDAKYSYTDQAETDPVHRVGASTSRVIVRGNTVWLRIPRGPEERYAGIHLVSPVQESDRVEEAPVPDPAAPPPLVVRALPERTLELDAGVTLRLRQCPAGTFTMGRPQSWNPNTTEWPATEVTIPSPYWLGETEVTQAQFRAVTGVNPSWFVGDDLPVHSLTMVEIVAFLDTLNARERAVGRLEADEEYRLPTEAEWEQACRAGTDTRYFWGDDPAAARWYAVHDRVGGPQPVGVTWANPWGFRDMTGNILEILAEGHDDLPGGPSIDPFTRNGRLIHWYSARGGAWNLGGNACQSTLRRGIQVLSRTYFTGFRLARGHMLDNTSTRFSRYRPQVSDQSSLRPADGQ